MCSACLNRQVNIVGWEGGVRTALLGALAAKLAFSLPALCCWGCARGRQAGRQEGREAGRAPPAQRVLPASPCAGLCPRALRMLLAPGLVAGLLGCTGKLELSLCQREVGEPSVLRPLGALWADLEEDLVGHGRIEPPGSWCTEQYLPPGHSRGNVGSQG